MSSSRSPKSSELTRGLITEFRNERGAGKILSLSVPALIAVPAQRVLHRLTCPAPARRISGQNGRVLLGKMRTESGASAGECDERGEGTCSQYFAMRAPYLCSAQ